MLFGGALEAQFRVLHALMLRETRTRFGVHQLGYLWALIEPLMWIATFYLLFMFIDRRLPPGIGMFSFLTTGLIPFMLFRQTLTQAMNAISANQALLFYPMIRPLDLVLARMGLEVATLLAVFIIILGFNALYVGELSVQKPLQVLGGLFLAGLLGTGLGLLSTSLSTFIPAVLRVVPLVLRPMIWISGVWFTANELPTGVRDIMMWNPLLQITELLRDGWYSQYTAHDLDLAYVAAWILIPTYFGLVLERLARRRLELG
ncbi:MAG TPA: hypothetical protein ENI96_13365 [Sedimenticola thiotaurini]|uniref:Transport permease protein n=1 Tax=Sedimenticola thiotaurini TaxID=1543721 RepID=A0A831RMU6_9GAMM|nr:hypothetical protein [Sedimenticola thiotaurini]